MISITRADCITTRAGSTKCSYFDPTGELVKWLYILAVYYSTMHFLIKNAFLTYYLRLSINRSFRLWVGLGFGLNIGLLLINLALIVFQCIPVAAAFTPMLRIKGAECMNRYYVLMAPSTVVRTIFRGNKEPELIQYDRTLFSTSMYSYSPSRPSGNSRCPGAPN